MRHARDPDEFLEVARDELRSVVGNDPRLCIRVLLPGALKNDFDIGLRHGFAQIPMNDEPAEAIQHAAQVVERAADVDIGNVDVPMLLRLQRLLEARSLA